MNTDFPLRRCLLTAAFFAAASTIPAAAAAQQYDVKGVVVDSTGKGLSGAMVVALTRADSVISTFETTRGSGDFTLKRLTPGEYILQITRVGFAPMFSDFEIGNANVFADTVRMSIQAVELDELVVRANIPIVNNLDTLEYNAGAFRTRPNATVEDLLERLPGVQVEADGSIKAQGEDVGKVLVDGKEFFGDDPKVATQNLPADAVDKVQVFDKKSDAAEFTGIDDGQEEKAINLVLKEEARVGYFGRVQAGAGPGADGGESLASSPGDDPRYSGAFNVNRFSPTVQLAAIANLDNIGQGGFSKGGGMSTGFSDGYQVGLNASQDFGRRNWIRSSYYLNSRDNRLDEVTNEQQLQGALVAALRNETAAKNSEGLNHRFSLDGQRSFSAWHQLRFRGGLTVNSALTSNLTQQETRDPSGFVKNSAVTGLNRDSDNLSGNANLTWRKRLNQAGRSLVAEGRASLSSPDAVSDLTSTTLVANLSEGGFDTTDVIQTTLQDGRLLNYSGRLGITEPLGGGHILELFGQYRSVNEDKLLAVDDLSTGTPVPNDFLSSEFERTYSYLMGGTRFSRNSEKTRWVLGLQVQNSQLDGEILNRDATISNGYTHLLPSANLRRQFGTGQNLNVRYSARTSEPSMTQLQPFVNNVNPISTYIGNPDLQPSYTHSGRVDYRSFDQFTFTNIYGYLNLGYTRNSIVQSRTIDEVGKQEITPVNLGNLWTVRGGFSFGSPVRALGIQADLEYGFNRTSGLELVNAVQNDSRVVNHNVGIKLQNRNKDLFDVTAGAKIGFNSVNYSLNDRLNQNYRSTTLYGEGTYYMGSAWSVSTDANYQIYDQELFGQVDNVTLVNASISRLLMDGLGEIELTAYDLLNQNQGVSISSNATLIQDRRTASLGRHFLVRFSYRFGSGPANGGGRGMVIMDRH